MESGNQNLGSGGMETLTSELQMEAKASASQKPRLHQTTPCEPLLNLLIYSLVAFFSRILPIQSFQGAHAENSRRHMSSAVSRSFKRSGAGPLWPTFNYQNQKFHRFPISFFWDFKTRTCKNDGYGTQRYPLALVSKETGQPRLLFPKQGKFTTGPVLHSEPLCRDTYYCHLRVSINRGFQDNWTPTYYDPHYRNSQKKASYFSETPIYGLNKPTNGARAKRMSSQEGWAPHAAAQEPRRFMSKGFCMTPTLVTNRLG